ncbi:E3 ubiquitin/ISG15 ligase TRIM25-like [Clupea harengus]|uniref:E3 ubiquitin/ISG15 ligase TRIM25-like n=1 Tax=Clupea harengus TaxID=7950 RepID=A0A6P8F877_CLUHA|nr:E3 ubiquitin/ISG15 ligase TRIM25-like [Clupea harengus]
MAGHLRMEGNIKCLLCEDYLSEPTTLPCGHNFCVECIERCWDMEVYTGIYSCPQCKRTLTRRPSLSKNTALAIMVQEVLELRSKLPGVERMKIQRDFTDTKERLKKQTKEREEDLEKLRSAMISLEKSAETAVLDSEGIFDELLRTLEEKRREHREHIRERKRAILKRAEREEKQIIGQISILRRKDTELESPGPPVQDNPQFLQKLQDIKSLLQQGKQPPVITNNNHLFSFVKTDMNDLRVSVVEICDKAIENIKQQVNDVHILPPPMVKPRTKPALDVNKKKVTVVRHVDLKVPDEDHMRYQVPAIPPRERESQEPLNKPKPPRLVARSQSTIWHGPRNKPCEYATSAEIRQSNTIVYQTKLTDHSMTREDLLQYTCSLSLNPETANPSLQLSDGNRKATWSGQRQRRSSLSKAFEHWEQVLCVEGLVGPRCYWEVEWRGRGVFIGVALDGLCRRGRGLECGLGRNASSWSLHCADSQCTAWHNNVEHEVNTQISSPRIGVFLDQLEGTLTFYSVSNTAMPLHTFTAQNLRGLLFPCFGVEKESSVKLCQLEKK